MLLAEALRAGAAIEEVHAEPDALEHPSVRAARDAGVEVHEAAPGALAKVLDLTTPRGVVAVVRAAPAELSEVLDRAHSTGRPVPVLVSLQDPGNAGTLVRVAEATGCAGVVLTTWSVDVRNPKTVRATAGSVFRVPVVESVELDEVLEGCGRRGVPVLATVGHGGEPPEGAALLDGAVAVLVGAEAHGLPEPVVARCDGSVTLPMEGEVESLNAAVAGAVVLFEAARRRRSAGRDHRGAATGPLSTGGRSGAMGHNDPSMESSR